jgi:hypothetical protein
MPRSVELCQLVARAITHTTWNIPRIRDGDRRWRNIDNPHLVENPTHLNGHDFFEDAIFRAKGNHAGTGMEDGDYRYPGTVPRASGVSALPVEVLEIALST